MNPHAAAIRTLEARPQEITSGFNGIDGLHEQLADTRAHVIVITEKIAAREAEAAEIRRAIEALKGVAS